MTNPMTELYVAVKASKVSARNSFIRISTPIGGATRTSRKPKKHPTPQSIDGFFSISCVKCSNHIIANANTAQMAPPAAPAAVVIARRCSQSPVRYFLVTSAWTKIGIPMSMKMEMATEDSGTSEANESVFDNE